MTDNEKQELDRWLEKVRGEISQWRTVAGTTVFEARAWRDGQVHRAIAGDRHDAIGRMKVGYFLDPLFPKKDKAPDLGGCSCCPQRAVERFKIAVPHVVTTIGLALPPGGRPMGGLVEYHLALCQRCLADEIRHFLEQQTAFALADWIIRVKVNP